MSPGAKATRARERTPGATFPGAPRTSTREAGTATATMTAAAPAAASNTTRLPRAASALYRGLSPADQCALSVGKAAVATGTASTAHGTMKTDQARLERKTAP